VTPALLDRPASLLAECATGPLGAGGVTLEKRLNSVLHAVRTNGSAECPICHARMTRAREGDRCGGAECGGCGSSLT
jgi:hypothetical protein